jgi:hypothetical protein
VLGDARSHKNLATPRRKGPGTLGTCGERAAFAPLISPPPLSVEQRHRRLAIKACRAILNLIIIRIVSRLINKTHPSSSHGSAASAQTVQIQPSNHAASTPTGTSSNAERVWRSFQRYRRALLGSRNPSRGASGHFSADLDE